MSNFECPHCGMVNIDCGKDNYKTPREIELEQKLEKLRNYVEEYAGLYFDEQCTKEILQIIEGN